MISLTHHEIEQIQKAEAIAFANWLSFRTFKELQNPIETLYEDFKKEVQ